MPRYIVRFGPEAGRFAGMEIPYVAPGGAKGRALYELRVATGYSMEHILRLGEEKYEKADRGEAAYLAGFCSLRKAGVAVGWEEYLDEVSFGDLTPIEDRLPGEADEETSRPTSPTDGLPDAPPAGVKPEPAAGRPSRSSRSTRPSARGK